MPHENGLRPRKNAGTCFERLNRRFIGCCLKIARSQPPHLHRLWFTPPLSTPNLKPSVRWLKASRIYFSERLRSKPKLLRWKNSIGWTWNETKKTP